MKTWNVLLIAILLAAVTAAVTASLVGPAQAREGDTAALAVRDDLARISERLTALQEEQGRLAKALAENQLEAGSASSSERSAVGGVDEAVARWMEENAARVLGSARLAGDGAVIEVDADDQDLSKQPLQSILAYLTSLDSMAWGDDAYWQRLRDSGRIEEVVAEFERMAAQDPNNPDLQTALGGAYIQQLFGVGNSPIAGELAMKADDAFDRALELDEEHWEARFSKAVSLSNWPAFLGKTGEAIHQFETLVAQQEKGENQEGYEQTYLFLGNLYQQTGETDKALEAWRQGYARFPDNEDLRRQIELNSR